MSVTYTAGATTFSVVIPSSTTSTLSPGDSAYVLCYASSPAADAGLNRFTAPAQIIHVTENASQSPTMCTAFDLLAPGGTFVRLPSLVAQDVQTFFSTPFAATGVLKSVNAALVDPTNANGPVWVSNAATPMGPVVGSNGQGGSTSSSGDPSAAAPAIVTSGVVSTAQVTTANVIGGSNDGLGNIINATLTASSFLGVMDQLNIVGGTISNAQLTGTTIGGASVTGAMVSNASLSMKVGDLTAANQDALGPLASVAAGLDPDTPFNATQGSLAKASVSAAILTNARLQQSTVTGANTQGTSVTGATVTNATLTGATVTNAVVENGVLTGGTITFGQLTTGSISSGTLTSAMLTSATVTGGTVVQASVTSASVTGGEYTMTASSAMAALGLASLAILRSPMTRPAILAAITLALLLNAIPTPAIA